MTDIPKDVTLYCDNNTFKKLKKVAKKNNRTIIGQIRYMLEKEENQ